MKACCGGGKRAPKSSTDEFEVMDVRPRNEQYGLTDETRMGEEIGYLNNLERSFEGNADYCAAEGPVFIENNVEEVASDGSINVALDADAGALVSEEPTPLSTNERNGMDGQILASNNEGRMNDSVEVNIYDVGGQKDAEHENFSELSNVKINEDNCIIEQEQDIIPNTSNDVILMGDDDDVLHYPAEAPIQKVEHEEQQLAENKEDIQYTPQQQDNYEEEMLQIDDNIPTDLNQYIETDAMNEKIDYENNNNPGSQQWNKAKNTDDLTISEDDKIVDEEEDLAQQNFQNIELDENQHRKTAFQEEQLIEEAPEENQEVEVIEQQPLYQHYCNDNNIKIEDDSSNPLTIDNLQKPIDAWQQRERMVPSQPMQSMVDQEPLKLSQQPIEEYNQNLEDEDEEEEFRAKLVLEDGVLTAYDGDSIIFSLSLTDNPENTSFDREQLTITINTEEGPITIRAADEQEYSRWTSAIHDHIETEEETEVNPNMIMQLNPIEKTLCIYKDRDSIQPELSIKVESAVVKLTNEDNYTSSVEIETNDGTVFKFSDKRQICLSWIDQLKKYGAIENY